MFRKSRIFKTLKNVSKIKDFENTEKCFENQGFLKHCEKAYLVGRPELYHEMEGTTSHRIVDVVYLS